MKLNIITKRMQHHAGHSGYDRLLDYVNADKVIASGDVTFLQRVIGKVLQPVIYASGSIWYHRASFLSELDAAREWIKSGNQVFHYLYGENSYCYLDYMRPFNRTNRIICTYHLPQKRFGEAVTKTDPIRKLDHIVVMSTVQYEIFHDLVGSDRVTFVPHGIDIDYFRPAADKPSHEDKLPACLFVGSHLRDVETMSKAIRRVNQSSTRARFSIVTDKSNFHYFDGLENTELLTGVSDEKLLELYQYSDLFTLPLLDCTANNGILEAMACGLPVLTTDLQGAKDYTNSECAVLIGMQDDAKLAEEIIRLLGEPETLRQMALASREKSLEYSWENISRQMHEIYQRVLTE